MRAEEGQIEEIEVFEPQDDYSPIRPLLSGTRLMVGSVFTLMICLALHRCEKSNDSWAKPKIETAPATTNSNK